MISRESRLGTTFVKLADTLVNDFKVPDLLHELAETCVELLDTDAAGILLASPTGGLHQAGSSDADGALLAVLDVMHDRGPGVVSHATGSVVDVADVTADHRWADIAPTCALADYRAVTAVPLSLRHESIGALVMFRTTTGRMDPTDLEIAQALADVASIGLVQARLLRETQIVAEQLEHALESRVVIEQAKGIIAEQGQVAVDVAFGMFRSYARSHQRSLTDVATDIVAGTLTAADFPAP